MHEAYWMELLTGVSHNLNSEDFNWKSAIQNKKFSNVTMNYDSRFVIKKQLKKIKVEEENKQFV